MTTKRVITFCLADDFSQDLLEKALSWFPEITRTKGATGKRHISLNNKIKINFKNDDAQRYRQAGL